MDLARSGAREGLAPPCCSLAPGALPGQQGLSLPTGPGWGSSGSSCSPAKSPAPIYLSWRRRSGKESTARPHDPGETEAQTAGRPEPHCDLFPESGITVPMAGGTHPPLPQDPAFSELGQYMSRCPGCHQNVTNRTIGWDVSRGGTGPAWLQALRVLGIRQPGHSRVGAAWEESSTGIRGSLQGLGPLGRVFLRALK